jgi:hypothetical protein
MKWVDLCSLPGYEKSCVQVLKFVILSCILGRVDVVSMDQVSIVPSADSSGRKWVFLRDDRDDEMYFCETGMYDIQYSPAPSIGDCPDTALHRIAMFLSSVYEATKNGREFSVLHQLLFRLRGDWPPACDRCALRKKQEASIHPLIRSLVTGPFSDLQRALPLMDECVPILKILTDQTRSASEVLRAVRDAYHAVAGFYEKSLLEGDKKEVENCPNIFRRVLIDDLRVKLPFITTKSVDFVRLLHGLFYIHQLREEGGAPVSCSSYGLMLRKLWLLLNLYMTEPKASAEESICVFVEEDEVEMESESMAALRETHPLKRADRIQMG